MELFLDREIVNNSVSTWWKWLRLASPEICVEAYEIMHNFWSIYLWQSWMYSQRGYLLWQTVAILEIFTAWLILWIPYIDRHQGREWGQPQLKLKCRQETWQKKNQSWSWQIRLCIHCREGLCVCVRERAHCHYVNKIINHKFCSNVFVLQNNTCVWSMGGF